MLKISSLVLSSRLFIEECGYNTASFYVIPKGIPEKSTSQFKKYLKSCLNYF